MGCSSSSPQAGSEVNKKYVAEIAALKKEKDKNTRTLDKLKKENDALKEENSQLKEKNAVQVQSRSMAPQSSSCDPQTRSSLPKVGDKVLSMWSVSMWQYFTATIVKFDPSALQFEIIWDDQDPSGRIIDYYNLALDRVPDDDEVAVGSVVLFPQGQYKGQQGVRLGGERWHQGRITSVSKDKNGIKLYSGVHTKGQEDGKWVTYKGYNNEFDMLRRNQLRIAPNVLELLSAETAPSNATSHNSEVDFGDIYISFSKLNSMKAVRNKEISDNDLPPSYEEAMASMCDPYEIRDGLQQRGLSVCQDTSRDLMKIVQSINNAKVVIAFLSDEYAQDEICRQEFQYAKKTAKKTVIPVVVGESFNWMMSVIGLLVTGELYIHFKNKTVQDNKMEELLRALNKSVSLNEKRDTESTAQTSAPAKKKKAEVFISYCWSNSKTAFHKKQMAEFTGSEFSDPRRLKEDLEKSGFNLWMDVDQLESPNQSEESSSMFQQIALGLCDAKVIVPFISEEYSKSSNCKAELQFAVTSLKKPIVPVIVGSGDGWMNTLVGLLTMSQDTEPVNMQSISTQEEYDNAIRTIKENIGSLIGKKEEKTSSRAPKIGDHVVSHHQKWAYFFSTVASFNTETMEYTVNWDDGDTTGRVQSYKNLAIDAVPSPDQIGVDSIVFFPQGSYGGSEGNNTGGGRFHEGVITNIHKDKDGVTLYDGHHTKGEDDGKWVTYKDYQHEFQNRKIEQLRVAPNAMDALLACKQAFLKH